MALELLFITGKSDLEIVTLISEGVMCVLPRSCVLPV